MDNIQLDEMLKTGTALRPDGKKVPLHSHLSGAEVALLQKACGPDQPRASLEVGMAMGVSTLAMLEVVAETHYAIDPNQRTEWDGIGLDAVSRCPWKDKFVFVERPSHLALPALLQDCGQRSFDLILIDGWHAFDTAFIDYFYSDLLLDDGGVLLLDDVDLPQIGAIVDFIDEYKFYRRIEKRDQLLALRKERTNTVDWLEDFEKWICSTRAEEHGQHST